MGRQICWSGTTKQKRASNGGTLACAADSTYFSTRIEFSTVASWPIQFGDLLSASEPALASCSSHTNPPDVVAQVCAIFVYTAKVHAVLTKAHSHDGTSVRGDDDPDSMSWRQATGKAGPAYMHGHGFCLCQPASFLRAAGPTDVKRTRRRHMYCSLRHCTQNAPLPILLKPVDAVPCAP
jgi:hypothetical protein